MTQPLQGNEAAFPLGEDLFGDPVRPLAPPPLQDRFVFPPFSILDGRQGDWMARKQLWLAYGLQSELGRGENLIFTSARTAQARYKAAERAPFNYYRSDHPEQFATDSQVKEGGTSIFDPVLCELMYRWFAPKGGQVVDPFCGGSVRGIIASLLERRYWGCDLRAEQVAANNQQAADLLAPGMLTPKWVCGDALEAVEQQAPHADFVFSCPPYGDLEQYSDDPRDISTMAWPMFLAVYRRIIKRTVARLKPDRYAAFVVGDFRDPKTGCYRAFVPETVQAFREAGARLYNDGILITPVGTAAMRVTKHFEVGRKFAKTHQNILVFVKGNWRKAAAACNGGVEPPEEDTRE